MTTTRSGLPAPAARRSLSALLRDLPPIIQMVVAILCALGGLYLFLILPFSAQIESASRTATEVGYEFVAAAARDVAIIKRDIGDFKDDIGVFKNDIGVFKNDIRDFKIELEDIHTDSREAEGIAKTASDLASRAKDELVDLEAQFNEVERRLRTREDQYNEIANAATRSARKILELLETRRYMVYVTRAKRDFELPFEIVGVLANGLVEAGFNVEYLNTPAPNRVRVSFTPDAQLMTHKVVDVLKKMNLWEYRIEPEPVRLMSDEEIRRLPRPAVIVVTVGDDALRSLAAAEAGGEDR